jgi:hypothetical protein
VWDRAVHIAPIAKLPLADHVPIQGVPTGPRDHAWRSTEPATLVWAEALDGGDWNTKVPARDKILMQSAPFTAAPVELTRTTQRFGGYDWTEQKSIALLGELDENAHWKRTFIVNVDDPKTAPTLLWDMSYDERYKDPGSPVYKVLPNGQWVVRVDDGKTIYLSGDGASTEGDRPFLDRLDLTTKQTARLFRSEKTAHESVLSFTDNSSSTSFLTWHQTPADPPNAFVRTLGTAVAGVAAGEAGFASTSRAVTHIPDPTPVVRAIKKKLVKYKRKDGTDLSFTLYLPPDYKEGQKLPAILYAYPLDYASAKTAGQVSGSEQYFTRITDYRLLLLSGYAIIDDAAFPIVGDPKQAYDTYLEHDRSRSDRRDRSQPRRADDGEPARAHRPVPRGCRDERLLQQDADPVRLPERAPQRVEGPRHLSQGVAVLLRRQDQAAPPDHARRRGREPRYDAAASDQALRGDPRQRRRRASRDAAARAALVLGHGVERAARVRGAALVRYPRQARAGEGRSGPGRGPQVIEK